MGTRFERRVTELLVSLTLRKALGLILAVATTLAITAAVLERLIDPAFETFPQALWFTVTTVSTVGYGDYVPESGSGRVVAAVLMLTGLALIPLLTSVTVSILVAKRSREARDEELRDLTAILERLDGLDRRLEALKPQ
jgi:voltage-gated potassium channel